MPLYKSQVKRNDYVCLERDFRPGTHVQDMLTRHYHFPYLVVVSDVKTTELGDYVMVADKDKKWVTWVYLQFLKPSRI
jgi:hypothetical protein